MHEPDAANENSAGRRAELASTLFFFLLYTAALSALFFGKLATKPLGLDEVLSFLQVADRSFPDFLASFSSGTNFFPYSYFAGLWLIDQVSSSTPLSLRLPSLIFAILAVFAFHVTLRRYFGEVIAFVACVGSLFVAPNFLRYCCEARPYSLYVLMAALTLYAGDLMLRARTEDWRPAILNGFIAFALPSVHYVGIFYSATAALALTLVAWKANSSRLLVRAVLSFVAGWTAFLAVHATQIARLREGSTAIDPTWIPVPTLQSSLQSFLAPLQLPVLVGLVLVFVIGAAIWANPPAAKRPEIAATPSMVFLFLASLFWLLLPGAFGVLAALGFPNLSLPRYFLPSALGAGVMIGLLLHLFLSAYDLGTKLRTGISSALIVIGLAFLFNQAWGAARGAIARPGRVADFPGAAKEQPILTNNHHVYFPYLYYNFYGRTPGKLLLIRRTGQEVESFKKLSPAVEAIEIGSLPQVEAFTYLYGKCPRASKSCLPEFDIHTWAKKFGYTIVQRNTRRGVTEYELSRH